MERLLLLLLCCTCVCKGQQTSAIDSQNSIGSIVVNSYDVSRTFDENFYTLLGIICPQSIYCSGNDTSSKLANGNVFENMMNDETTLITDATSNNQSYLISEARANLKAKVDALQDCCTSCSCEDDCAERNNCCPAMEPAPERTDSIEPERRVIQECVYANIKTYLEVWFFRDEAYGHSYFMVTDCYSDNVSEELITKCRRPDPEFPEEVIPVYSASSGRNYKNRFCAECNNDNTLTPWLLKILFNKEYSLTEYRLLPSTPTEMYKNLIRDQRSLNVFYIPPTNLYFQSGKFECILSNPKTVSECKQSYDYDNMNIIERACAAHQINYETSWNTYDNVFCFLCQSGEKICKAPSSRSISVSFGALLDVASIKPGSRTETTRNTETPCSDVEYFDQAKKICRDLQCPPGQAFDDGKCVDFLRNITNLRIKIYLEIVPDAPRNLATIQRFTNQLDEKASTLEIQLNRWLEVRWGVTRTTISLVFRETSSLDSSHMVLHFVSLLYFDGVANVRVIMKNMFNALRIGLSARILGVSVKIKLGRIFEIAREGNANLASLYDSDTIIDPLGSALAGVGSDVTRDYKFTQTLNKLMFCKRVVLEEDEIELLRNNSSAVGLSQTYVEYVFYDKDGSMCLDDFEKAFLPLDSKAGSLRLHSHVVYLTCLIFYI